MVTHKTFHRYTVRAKRGTAQGIWDARGGASRSAGANLRRYNEATLYKVSSASQIWWSANLLFFPLIKCDSGELDTCILPVLHYFWEGEGRLGMDP